MLGVMSARPPQVEPVRPCRDPAASEGGPRRAALRSVRTRRCVGLKGTLVFRRESAELRFTVGDGVQLNRRSATRVKLALPLRLHRLGTPHARPGQTVDVRADGILAETSLQAAVGDRIQVEIELGLDAPPASATARVVRQASGLLAMQFAPEEAGVRSASRDSSSSTTARRSGSVKSSASWSSSEPPGGPSFPPGGVPDPPALRIPTASSSTA